MATFTAKGVADNAYVITALGKGQPVVNQGSYEVPATLAADDLVKLAFLPAEHTLVDVILEADDLDTNGTPTITISVGTLNSAGDDIENLVITTSTVAQGGGVARAATVAGLQVAASSSDRVLTAKIITGGATAAAGTLKLKAIAVAS